MPELPEVETCARQLQRLVGKRIKEVTILNDKVFSLSVKKAKSAKIKAVYRRGKNLVFELSDGRTTRAASSKGNKPATYLYAHLRMTGHFYYIDKQNRPDY